MNLLTFFISSLLMLVNPNWLTDMEKAKTEAKASHKLILLNFSGSDWCGPCIKLTREVFDDGAFEKYAEENLVLVNADFPRQKKNKLSPELTKHNEKLADEYNKTGTFPLTLLLDENGKVLKKWEGNPGLAPQQFVAALQTIKK